MAKEGRYYCIGASGMLKAEVLHEFLKKMDFEDTSKFTSEEFYQNGGSVVYSPKGECIKGPLIGKEGILVSSIEKDFVIQERQNFDYSGHYSRFDIFNEPLRTE